MYQVTKYPHGAICWVELQSSDQAVATAFFQALMGWELNAIPLGEYGFYNMMMQEGLPITAVASMPPDLPEGSNWYTHLFRFTPLAEGADKPQLPPSMWATYINVDSVDALVEKVKKHGGTILEGPFDVMEEGRQLTVQDPSGAIISFWEARNHIGARLVNTVGAMLWNELLTREPEKAVAFYGAVLGWTFQKEEQVNVWQITNGNRPTGMILKIEADWGDIPPMWLIYFTVANVDTALEQVVELGGKIHMGKTTVPNVGEFGFISDPTGALVYVMEKANPQPSEE